MGTPGIRSKYTDREKVGQIEMWLTIYRRVGYFGEGQKAETRRKKLESRRNPGKKKGNAGLKPGAT